ncbi:MAG: YggS family pyridoxal phosphate-dependent enzyme [Bauldia sp.]|nr:YggS family pyridoxal phosphate-dependent enzyme [Bauldia sp.]
MRRCDLPADAGARADEGNAAAASRLAEVRRRIAVAEREAGRPEGSARLIAVSKTFDSDAIRPLIAGGQRVFGENRVQEAKAKWPALRAETPGLTVELIGPLQSNKAAEAVALFDAIHSVDRDKIADALAKEMRKQGRSPRLLVQVNIGEEPQKAGVAPAETAAFVERCRTVYGLTIDGLMCIPPLDEPPGPHFALTAKLARELGLTALSMGMSADFELAIAYGATELRIGSALFGTR